MRVWIRTEAPPTTPRRRVRPPIRRPSPGPTGGLAAVRRPDGQAAAELVALLPLAALVIAAAWQLVLAGHASWAAGAAARAAARAAAVGADARAAARAELPARLERGLRVREREPGSVEVALRIPPVLGLPVLGDTTATAHFRPQR
jgi:hypothetical protein